MAKTTDYNTAGDIKFILPHTLKDKVTINRMINTIEENYLAHLHLKAEFEEDNSLEVLKQAPDVRTLISFLQSLSTMVPDDVASAKSEAKLRVED